MALQKQAFPINFSQGLDTKTDPKQVQFGKFLALQNSVFDKAGSLVKRNGYSNLANLPNSDQTTLTTLKDNLIATGSNLYAYSTSSSQWLNQGTIQPVQLNTISLVRNSSSQSNPESASTADGLSCLVYTDGGQAYYHIIDRVTGYQVVPRTALAAGATHVRVFLLGVYFIITYLTASSLKYIVIPVTQPTSPSAVFTWSPSVSGVNAGYNGFVADNDELFIAWTDSANQVKILKLNRFLQFPIGAQSIGVFTATRISLVEDPMNDVIYLTIYDGTDIYTSSYSYDLVPILTATHVSTVAINQLITNANDSLLTIIYENTHSYGFTPSSGTTVPTSYISKQTVTNTGVVSGASVVIRSLGLASETFTDSRDVIYMLGVFQETNQNTYFLIDTDGNIYMRLASTNGGGYYSTQVLPSVDLQNGVYTVPYLITDFLATVNKNTDIATNPQINAIYTQKGINLAFFTLNTTGQHSSEIAGALHLTGGQLWEYDGIKPVEHGFHVYPSPNSATTSLNGAISTATGAGNIAAGTYYYQFTYEWTDNQGNLHRSAPSIPIKQVTTTANSTNTIHVPTLRLTYKTGQNPVRIVGYRWSLANQIYYQFTSITSPILNDTTIDYVTITDTLADSAIIGNNIIYTTGSVVENIAAPPSVHSTLFKNRLFLIDAEDRNLLWFSKQVIESTPVEMSDLFTLYVAPTTGSQGSTGNLEALAAMDDKLIMFKKNALYYMTGIGPDNTGANNDFSDPVFITAAVGSANPSSIVLMPNGLMFQSDKGIWLLGRDLQTNYIGAAVEQYNDSQVMSAETIPGTNQVRFVLDNNVTLVYDYFYGQWGTFNNTFAISATLFQNQHTYLNQAGQIFTETPGTYLDGSQPVLLSLTTSWINIAGVQGFERFYEMYLLGKYFSPFTLQVKIAYDYNDSVTQSTTITPDNYGAAWGGESQWGSGGPWGGLGNVFEARLFPERQKCESFQITLNEVWDQSYGVEAGQGLNLSGLNLVIGTKKGYRTQKSSQSFG